MPEQDEIQFIRDEMAAMRAVFLKVVEILPSFNITDSKVLPYGLKAHTRSISWIVEQVITQKTKYHAKVLGLNNVDFDVPDTSLHDCIIDQNGNNYYVNVKIHNVDGGDNKNDISAVEKLYTYYLAHPEYRLIYAIFGVKFENVKISFVKEDLHIFSPQFMPIYVNPRNDKIQAYYHHTPQYRTRREFLHLLRTSSKSIKLGLG